MLGPVQLINTAMEHDLDFEEAAKKFEESKSLPKDERAIAAVQSDEKKPSDGEEDDEAPKTSAALAAYEVCYHHDSILHVSMNFSLFHFVCIDKLGISNHNSRDSRTERIERQVRK